RFINPLGQWVGLCGMSLKRNIVSPQASYLCNASGRVLSVICLMLLMPALVTAQQGEAMLQAPSVDWSHGMQAYRLAEKWAAGMPLTDEEAKHKIMVSRLAGVRVTLRWLGKTMGTGDAVTVGFGADHAVAVDLCELVRQATNNAVE